MQTNLQTWLNATIVSKVVYGFSFQSVRPHLECNDGTTLSVQASESHYCTPRVNGKPDGGYTSVEVWCCSTTEGMTAEWAEYQSGDDPWAFLPVALVEKYVDFHGGINWKKYGLE